MDDILDKLDCAIALLKTKQVVYEKEEDFAPVEILKSHLEIYGPPNHDNYIVIDDCVQFESTYAQETTRYFYKIHRYDRLQRLINILDQLSSKKDIVPFKVIRIVKRFVRNFNEKTIWNDIREILKQNGWSKYYNSIPTISERIGFCKGIHVDDQCYQECIKDLKYMNQKFKNVKVGGRIYFPNMRYIVLKVLEVNYATFFYDIPFIRTERKKRSLDKIWNSF